MTPLLHTFQVPSELPIASGQKCPPFRPLSAGFHTIAKAKVTAMVASALKGSMYPKPTWAQGVPHMALGVALT